MSQSNSLRAFATALIASGPESIKYKAIGSGDSPTISDPLLGARRLMRFPGLYQVFVNALTTQETIL
jgi:hypothetical protein